MRLASPSIVIAACERNEVITLLTNATDDPKVTVHLLVYAVQTAITTSTCIADYMSWSNFSNAEKIELGKLYVPYLALCEYSSHRWIAASL